MPQPTSCCAGQHTRLRSSNKGAVYALMIMWLACSISTSCAHSSFLTFLSHAMAAQQYTIIRPSQHEHNGSDAGSSPIGAMLKLGLQSHHMKHEIDLKMPMINRHTQPLHLSVYALVFSPTSNPLGKTTDTTRIAQSTCTGLSLQSATTHSLFAYSNSTQ